MLRYVVRRPLWVVVLLAAISILTFLLFYLVPGDPAKQALGKGVPPRRSPKCATAWAWTCRRGSST
jgi:ABC-type dipeptide/oligopeptide/nickel transport system permease component